MGQAKRLMMEHQERGYGASDKIVCHECVGDNFLKQYIKKNGSIDICNYCGKSVKSIGLEELMKLIMDGIWSEYEDAIGCMGFNSREGGYIGAKTWNSYDLIHDELCYELKIDNESLLDDIANLIDDGITWCPKSPYSLRDHDEHYYTWKSFSDQLKNSVRYVFFKLPTHEDNQYKRYKKPSDILETIAESISDLDLVSKIKKNTPLYRGRMHNETELVKNAKSLGAPPSNRAKAGRMNPEGISMFYAAFDELTALKEIYDMRRYQATIGIFYNQKRLNVINLNKISNKQLPSIFDIVNRESRISLLFLRKFISEITSKVNDDDLLAYIPTQVVTEYFRYVYRTHDGKNIDGLIYPSSLRKDGKCIVLFFDSESCSDDKDKSLWLDKSSIKHIKVSSIKLAIPNE
jgi:hypothetical protein